MVAVGIICRCLFDLDFTLFLRESSGESGTARLLLDTGQHCVRESQNDTECLDGKDGLPEASCLNAQNGSRTHCRACPRHQVQNAHGQDCDAQERGLTHMHAREDRQHGRNDDTERRSAAAVQMAYKSNDAGDDTDADDVVSDKRHELSDDHIEHARVGHDAKIQNGENEQRRGRSRALKAGRDHFRDVFKAVSPH